MGRILILGGTKDARLLAQLCVDRLGPDTEVITSLAGRTRKPQAVAGTIRIGGFGGTAGLTDYIKNGEISVLVDATHPFASTISNNAAQAASKTGIPRVMIDRPIWGLPTELNVTRVPSLESAAATVKKRGSKNVFLTTGINGLDVFGALTSTRFVVRQIEDHEGSPPFDGARVIVQKPPFDVTDERNTMSAHGVDTLITKESGGSATEAKLQAAADLGIHVIMVERPALPAGETVSSPEEALGWISGALGS